MSRVTRSSLVGKTTSVWVTQATVMSAQVVYAGVSSRSIPATGFGAYAVALTLTSFTGIIAGLGLATASARRGSTTGAEQRALGGVALLSGFLVAAAMVAVAAPWASLWGNPAAATLTRTLALSMLLGPYAGVMMGTLRREGRVLSLNLVTVVASATGMLLGAWAVTSTDQAWALTVMPISTSVGTAMLGATFVGRDALPSHRISRVKGDISFGGRSMATAFITISAYAISQVGMSRHLGATVLGSWNRGMVVGQLPAESAVRAVLTVTFPHFPMSGRLPDQRRLTRTDLTVSFALLFWPISAVVLPVVPVLTVVWLGPNWGLAGQMAMWLWVTAAVQAPRTVLASLMEACAEFRVLVLGEFALGVGLLLATILMITSGDWLSLAWGGLLASVASHCIQLVLAHRKGLIHGRTVLRNYVPLVISSAALSVLSFALLRNLSAIPMVLGATAELTLVVMALMWVARRPGALRRVTERGLRRGPAPVDGS